MPQGIDIEQVADQPKVVDHAIVEFEHSFLEALGIVLLVSFLSLGLRTGIVVALSVPLVLAITFAVMSVLGIDLHRITLGALIIALGLLVDDAIIAVEMMVVKIEQGWDRVRAASFAWTSTAFPDAYRHACDCSGLPADRLCQFRGRRVCGRHLLGRIDRPRRVLVRGGDLHPLSRRQAVACEPRPARACRSARDLRDPPLSRPTPGRAGLRQPARVLRSWRRSRIFVGLGRRIRPRAAAVLPAVRAARAVLPDAAAGRHCHWRHHARPRSKARSILGEDPDILTHTTYIGQGSPRFWLGLNPQLPNEAFAEIVIVSKDVDARERIKARVERAVAEGALAEARVRVDRFNFGPPVGFPVQFRVVGPDADESARNRLRSSRVMRANTNVVDPHLEWNEMTPSVRLVVDQERARALGLDPQTVSQTLQTLLSGAPLRLFATAPSASRSSRGRPSAERLDLSRIGDLTIVSRNGLAVPLAQVGKHRVRA